MNRPSPRRGARASEVQDKGQISTPPLPLLPPVRNRNLILRANDKDGLGLNTRGLGKIGLTPEMNIEDSRVRWRVRHHPIVKLHPWIKLRGNPGKIRLAAIEREIEFHLAPRQIHPRNGRFPFNPNDLSRLEHCPSRRRNQPRTISGPGRGCGRCPECLRSKSKRQRQHHQHELSGFHVRSPSEYAFPVNSYLWNSFIT